MTIPPLHTGLEKLLLLSGVSQYPDVALLPAYIPGEPDTLSAGILQLVKFRLLKPAVPVLFFSFHAKEQLLSKDAFGVLALEGTEFIRLPCTREIILQAVAKYNSNQLIVSSAKWRLFSENACKKLLQQRMRELTHGNKLAVGNQAINPIRMACVAILSMPSLKPDYLPVLEKNFTALKNYIAIPEIAELLQWAAVCQASEDDFLKTTFSFVTQLKELANHNPQTDAEHLIFVIDQLNDSFSKLQNL